MVAPAEAGTLGKAQTAPSAVLLCVLHTLKPQLGSWASSMLAIRIWPVSKRGYAARSAELRRLEHLPKASSDSSIPLPCAQSCLQLVLVSHAAAT